MAGDDKPVQPVRATFPDLDLDAVTQLPASGAPRAGVKCPGLLLHSELTDADVEPVFETLKV